MKLLVTGGAGFIGSNFVRYALSEHSDVEIVNLDALTYSGRRENMHDFEKNPRHTFVKGDIQDGKVVEKIVGKGIDGIVNFAAETHVDRSIAGAGSFVLTDVYGTYVLLEAARKCDVGKFMQISTDEVYGSIERGSFREVDALQPSSPYSASKAAADMMVQAFAKTYGLHATMTRSSNNFGPYQHLEKFIPKMIARAIHDQPLPIYGDGRQVRDWIYVTDNCAAIDLAMRKGKKGEIYNIASGEEHANIEIAKLILKALGKSEKLIKSVADRPGHDRRYSLNTDRIRELGWKPKQKFGEALEKTVKWYVENKWWWQPLLKDEFVKADMAWLK